MVDQGGGKPLDEGGPIQIKFTREKLYLSPISYDSKPFDQHLKEYWAKEEKMLKAVGVIKEPATQPN